MRLVAWFQIIVGASIAALWVVLLAAGQVPELDAGMRGIWFHLVAEFALAGLLLGAGLSLLVGVAVAGYSPLSLSVRLATVRSTAPAGMPTAASGVSSRCSP
jgi:hypothetical protein